MYYASYECFSPATKTTVTLLSNVLIAFDTVLQSLDRNAFY